MSKQATVRRRRKVVETPSLPGFEGENGATSEPIAAPVFTLHRRRNQRHAWAAVGVFATSREATNAITGESADWWVTAVR